MKLDNKNVDFEGGFGIETKSIEISDSQKHKLWDLLQNPYKNSIGSIVREITSNCFDSHIEAGVTDAVIIKFDNNESDYSITFTDVGVGLSPERINNIYIKVLSSTKDNSNDFIGALN